MPSDPTPLDRPTWDYEGRVVEHLAANDATIAELRAEVSRLQQENEAWMNGVADVVEPYGFDRSAACGPADLLPGLESILDAHLLAVENNHKLLAEVSRLTETLSRLDDAIRAFMAVDAVVSAAAASNDLDRIADALGLWPAAVRALAAALESPEPPSPPEPTYPLIDWRKALDESQKVDARDTIPADGIDYEPPPEPPSDPDEIRRAEAYAYWRSAAPSTRPVPEPKASE